MSVPKKYYEELYGDFIHNVTDIELVDYLVELRETIENLENEKKVLKETMKFVLKYINRDKTFYYIIKMIEEVLKDE